MTIPIPVIGTAIVSNPSWVTRLLMSIDYPVNEFIIINNNGRGEIDEQLNSLTKITHKFVKKITVTHLPANIGCAGAWNLIIKSCIMSPYWIIVNDDVSFGPGCLNEMVNYVNDVPDLGIVHGCEGDYSKGSWELFLITECIIKMFGLFDENTYPAYCEDIDYIMRFMHRPIVKKFLTTKYYHGMGSPEDYCVEGSQTQKSEPELIEKLQHSKNLNSQYLTEKWGPCWNTYCPSQFPFGDKDISHTTYDLEFVRKKYLGF